MIAVAVGIALVALSALDALVSARSIRRVAAGQLPGEHGGLEGGAARAGERLQDPRLMHLGGPIAVLAVFGTSVMMLSNGFALILLPHIGELSYDSATSYGEHTMSEAL